MVLNGTRPVLHKLFPGLEYSPPGAQCYACVQNQTVSTTTVAVVGLKKRIFSRISFDWTLLIFINQVCSSSRQIVDWSTVMKVTVVTFYLNLTTSTQDHDVTSFFRLTWIVEFPCFVLYCHHWPTFRIFFNQSRWTQMPNFTEKESKVESKMFLADFQTQF